MIGNIADGQRKNLRAKTGIGPGRLVPILLLPFLSLLLFYPILQGRVLVERDLQIVCFPHKWLAAAILSVGQLPVWNATMGCGRPLLADVANGLLDPLLPLYGIVSSPWIAGSVHLWLAYLLAGLGMYRYLRIVGRDSLSAFLGGSIFMLVGPSIGCWTLLPWAISLMWLPLALAAPHARGGPIGRGTAGAAILAFSLWNGAVEAFLYILFFWVMESLFLRRRAVEIMIGCAGGAAFSLAQSLPTAELFLLSERGGGLPAYQVFAYSVSPLQAMGIVLPVSFLGEPGAPSPEGLVPTAHPYLFSTYLGISVLPLAFLAPAGRNRRFFLCIAAGVLFSFGRYIPGAVSLLSTAPWLAVFRYPVKALVLCAAPLAVLASAGLMRMTTVSRARCGRSLAAVATIVLVISAAGIVVPDPEKSAVDASLVFIRVSSLLAEAAVRALVALLALGVALFAGLEKRQWARPLAVCIVAIDLLLPARAALRFDEPVIHRTPALRQAMPETWPRIATVTGIDFVDEGISPAERMHRVMQVNTGAGFRVRQAAFYGAFRMPQATAWIDPGVRLRGNGFFYERVNGDGLARFAAASVSYIAADHLVRPDLLALGCDEIAHDEDLSLFAVPDALPEVRFYPGRDRPRLRDLLGPGRGSAPALELDVSGAARVRGTVSEAGWLYRAETWYPGWGGREGDRILEVEPAGDFMGQLVFLDRPGYHEVLFELRSRSLEIGILAALAASVTMMIALWKSAYRARGGGDQTRSEADSA